MFGDKWQKGVTRWVIRGAIACLAIGAGIAFLISLLT